LEFWKREGKVEVEIVNAETTLKEAIKKFGREVQYTLINSKVLLRYQKID